MYWDFKKVIIFCLILLLFGLIFSQYKLILKLVYPFLYQDLIFNQAIKNDLDPYLVAAVIYVESKFDPWATSNKGARGLMQIMPKTGIWISDMLEEDFITGDLYKPEINIKYGCWYLSWLQNKFKGELAVTLAAYNGGFGNVNKWLNSNQWDGKHENVHKIPFAQTRGYVNKVIKVYRKYKFIYSSKQENK
ncbi:lytic transglycosylase domain-containing protein [Halanaerocella petrolearia]